MTTSSQGGEPGGVAWLSRPSLGRNFFFYFLLRVGGAAGTVRISKIFFLLIPYFIRGWILPQILQGKIELNILHRLYPHFIDRNSEPSMSASLQEAHRGEDSYSDSDSASDSLNIVSGNDEGWEDIEPEEESQPIVGLFSADVYPDVRSMLKDTKERHNFDLVKVQRDLGM